jgi:hypothetical protein
VSDTAVERRPEGWFEREYGEPGPGGLPLNATSQALGISLIVKSGAGSLVAVTGFNNNAAARFLHIFDTQGALANGMVPVVVISVAIAGNYSQNWTSLGRAFARGIVLANSTTAATLTLGTADFWFDAQYF